MFELYTEKARRATFFARYEASIFGSPEITTEHLLLGLLREDRALMNRLLGGDKAEAIRSEIEKHTPGATQKVSTSVDLPLSAGAKRVLAFGAEEAERLGHKHMIGTEHLLLGLLREEECLAAQILSSFNLTLTRAREEVAHSIRPPTPAPEPARALKHLLVENAIVRGARWTAGYVRKTDEIVRQFNWAKRACARRDALLDRNTGKISLHTGQPYDVSRSDLVEGGWTHDHCIICWKNLHEPNHPGPCFAYTNGQDWLCEKCYEAFVAPRSGSEGPEGEAG